MKPDTLVPGVDLGSTSFAKYYVSLLISLAHYFRTTPLKVDVRNSYTHKLAATDAGISQKRHQSLVSHSLSRIG